LLEDCDRGVEKRALTLGEKAEKRWLGYRCKRKTAKKRETIR